VDGSHFDGLTRSLVESRRSLLGGALALAGGTLGTATATARRRRKKKGKKAKKPKPNAFGCLSVGASCKSADLCCSGVCEGKKCQAHGTGTCQQGIKGVCEVPLNEAVLLKCNNDFNCYCYQTTAGSNFCSAPIRLEQCAICATDADCVALGFPPGSACAPVSQGHCVGTCDSGMACMVPCGSPLPDPQD
jgi:hypothetical protein